MAWKTRESGATWVYELEATATGTSVTGRRVLPKFTIGTSLLGPVIGGAQGHDAELAEGIRTTLERIRATVEADAGQPRPPAESAVGEHGGFTREQVVGAV